MSEDASAGTPLHSFGLSASDWAPLIAAAAGVAAGLSGQQPTGHVLADFALTAAFAGGVVQLARSASKQALEFSAFLALLFTALAMPWALIGAVGLGSALMVTRYWNLDPDSREIGAAITAALVVQVVLNLPSFRFVGSATLAAAIAVAPIVLSGVARLSGEVRRTIVYAAIAVATFAGLAAVLAVWAALSVRASVETGIEQAEQGVRAVEAADQERAIALLEAAEANFENATGRLRGPMTWPARVVPVVAQHSRALETTAREGARLAETAGRIMATTDLESIRGVNGRIELTEIERVAPEFANASSVLESAFGSVRRVRTPWLLPQLDRRLASVETELITIGRSTTLAALATDVVPGMLGADEARRYLVLFVQPAEGREYGGLATAYAFIEADEGQISLTEADQIGQLRDTDFGEAQLTGSFPQVFVELAPGTFPQNITGIPDLPTIARGARELVPQWTRDADFDIDGVITIDPYAIEAMLELTGPIRIERRDRPITADNVVDFLLRDQYVEFPSEIRSTRQDILIELANATFSRLLEIELPGPERLGEVFGPVARANRVAMATFDDAENFLLDRVLLSASVPQVGSAVDFYGLYTSTVVASKLDAHLQTRQQVLIEPDPSTGRVTTTITYDFTNTATPDLPGYVIGDREASNLFLWSLYTRAEVSEIVGSELNPDGPAEPRTSDAFGYQRHAVPVEVPPLTTVRVSVVTETSMLGQRHDVFFAAQPIANPPTLTVTVRPVEGWNVTTNGAADDGSWTETTDLWESRAFSFRFAPAS